MNALYDFFELSHTIYDGLVTYQGLPAPNLCDYWSRSESAAHYEDGSSFHIAKIEMVGNTGTYIDCPFHRYENGDEFDSITLDRFCDLETIVIDVHYKRHGMEIGSEHLDGYDLHNKAVLFHSGWDEYWDTEKYYTNHPYLHEATAQRLVNEGALLVGIDSYNIDNTQLSRRPVHSLLLGNNLLIVEHLTGLQHLPTSRKMWFTAAAPKITGTGSFPVRAFVKAQK